MRKTSEAKLLITVYVTAAEALPNPAHEEVISLHLMLSLHDDKHKSFLVVKATLLSQGRFVTIILFKWLSFHLTMCTTSHFNEQTAVATSVGQVT